MTEQCRTSALPTGPAGFTFLEHYPYAHKVSEHVTSYSSWFGVVVAHVPSGCGYDIFVPTEAARDVMLWLREAADDAEADYQNDLAAAAFDERYPPNGVESWGGEQEELDSELSADRESWARSEEEGWYYLDD